MKKIQKKRPSIPCFWKDTCMEIEAVEKIFQKKSKKSEPFGAFLERYLFGEIGNKFRCWEGIIGKNGKNQKQRRNFQSFWKDTCSETTGISAGS